MAYRLYFSTDAAAVSPAFDASWEATGAPTRRALTLGKWDTANILGVGVAEAVNNTTYDVAVAQFVSPPLSGNQTISGAIKGILQVLESSSAADMDAQCVIRVVSNDGTTVRGTLIASDTSALASEFPTTTAANRKFPKAWTGSGTTPTSVNALDTDRIVVEIGYRSHEASATSRTGTIRLGAPDPGLWGHLDLAENETDTGLGVPWIEFADTLVFVTETSRVSQDVAQVAGRWDADARISQDVAQVAGRWDADARVSQVVFQVAVAGAVAGNDDGFVWVAII